MAATTRKQDELSSLFADARLEDEETSQSDVDEESDFEDESGEEEDHSESTTASSFNNSPFASFGGSTSGISSMDNSEHLRGVSSTCTLDDLFQEQIRKDMDPLDTNDSLDVDVNFVVNLTNQPLATPQAVAIPEPQSYAPLKHFLQPICTIGTGSFGRVELTKHKETGEFYALKSLYIPSILERRQVNHVYNEKRILSKLNHPFIVRLCDTAKDNRCVYMVMEFLAGGELFSYLRLTRTLPSSVVKFYSAEVLLALEYMHSLKIAYRDLKPENLMLDKFGHIKLTDFGFAKQIDSKSFSLCGTSDYLAPELASRKGHDVSVDFWSLGVLIFELIAGFTPFSGETVDEVQSHIQACQGRPDFPHKTFSANNKSIIMQLLSISPKDRKTAPEIKQHPWFAEIEFDKLLAKKIKPPIIPTLYKEGDTGNFDTYEEIEKQPAAKQRDLDLFDDW